MGGIIRNRKAFILLFTTFAIVLFLSRCINSVEKTNDPRGNVYAGSLSCRQCHRSVYDLYKSTSHYNATGPAVKNEIHGSFKAGENTYSFNPHTKIVMENRDSGLFQAAYINGSETEAHRFDITFGRKHAQTFLYWKGNKAFELPVSFYTSVKSWGSSPGFPSAEIRFNRSIQKNCFECHSSFIESRLNMGPAGIDEELDKSSLIYGIDCERCHGPSINHVNYHLAYPEIKEAKYIVTSRSLSRQQKLDECAVCHSGNDKMKEVSTFKFKPGDTLANFFSLWQPRKNVTSDFDIHGNQYQLLAQSKCFLGSKTLTCTTCHNPHTDANSNLAAYSQKCLGCHQNTVHTTLVNEAGINAIKNNCIDCHMPKKASKAITFYLSGSSDKNSYMLRTHKIGVYSNDAAVKDFFQYLKKNKSS